MKLYSKNTIASFKDLFSTALVALIIFSCRTAEMPVDSGLKSNSDIYTVKGRQGFQIGQILSFGDFTTSKVKRGWTFGYSIPFIVQFNGAREKLSFQQFDHAGNSADIALVSRFKETEYAPLGDFFSITLNYKNYSAGSVKMKNADKSWDFIVHQVDGPQPDLNKNMTMGFIRQDQQRIEITGIRQLEGSPAFLTQNNVYGYEYRLDGEIIGSVSTVNNGKVWLKKGLSPEMQLLLASVSSGLMLRNNIGEESVSMN